MAGIPQAVTLSFIAKEQAQADALIEKYGKYFDDVVYRVGLISADGVTFSDARNELLPQIKTPFWFWIDTDDDIAGIDNLRPLIQLMEDRGLDAYYMQYEYGYNELGECSVLQWRERLIRTSHPFKWLGTIHESLISNTSPHLDRTKAMVIQHTKSQSEMGESAKRNHVFLVKAHKTDKDPRTTHYLALSYFNLKEYSKSIKLFEEHIRTSGWDEDKYRSLFYIGQAYGLQDKFEETLDVAMRGISLLPNRPEAYVLAATAELEMQHYSKTLEHLISAGTKEAPQNTLSAIDPTYYGYRAEFLAVLAHLHLGNIKEAYQQLRQVLEASPKYEEARNILPLIQELYDDRSAVSKIQWLADYYKAYNGKPEKLFEGLPPQLMSDPRLNKTRLEVFNPVKYKDNSIVIFCGTSAEQWGPDTLAKGMGGSEEAIVYLSRALAKLGWQVTIYNDREDTYVDNINKGHNAVTYLPWTLFNPNDEFNIIVGWRNPGFFRTLPIKAKFKAIDLHDMVLGHQAIKDDDIKLTDKYFVKSSFQLENSIIPPDKAAVISNGIVASHFDVEVKRNPYKVIYGSSADRGLECLVELWPEIKKQVPQAELHWYYGWNSFDEFHRQNPQQMKWKYQLIRKMHQAGVIVHGRVSHEDLAIAFKESSVWAYPTEFPEINCITAIKAGAAGCIPVTSGYAALQDTVLEDEVDYKETIYNNKPAQKDFIARVVKALKEGRSEKERAKQASKYSKFYWEKIAGQWNENLK